jgi:hypothetical protein
MINLIFKKSLLNYLITKITYKSGSGIHLLKKVLFLLLVLFLSSQSNHSPFAKQLENVRATLTVEVHTTIMPTEEDGKPINRARVIVINPLGKIIASELTNSNGNAIIPVTVPVDSRFPKKHMGVVTIIVVADGYNEFIDFSVPVNEYNDHTGRVSIPLQEIDLTKRNEPHFFNGRFHRFTVFEMLDYYAEKACLIRQNVKDPSVYPPPWGPELIKEKTNQ